MTEPTDDRPATSTVDTTAGRNDAVSSVELEAVDPGATIGPVRIELALDPSLVRIARLVGSGIVSLAGGDVDAVEDVRIATDEIATTCLTAGTTGPVTLTFTVEGGSVVITAKVPSGTQSTQRPELTDEILSVLVDSCQWVADGQFLRCRAVKRIDRPVAGAS
jgi:hypothetical protein